MIDSLEHYIDPEFVYNFAQGPNEVTDEQEARRNGINCTSLVHLVLRELSDSPLPVDLNCYEMFRDTTNFTTIDSFEAMQRGDLVWFGLAKPKIPIEEFAPDYNADGNLLNWADAAVRHIAIYTGEVTDCDYLMLHCTRVEGTNTVWPLRRFASWIKYESVYRIGRYLIT